MIDELNMTPAGVVGGVKCTYYVQQFGDTVHVGPLYGSDEDVCQVAEKLAAVTHTRWDVIKEEISHKTIATYWDPESS